MCHPLLPQGDHHFLLATKLNGWIELLLLWSYKHMISSCINSIIDWTSRNMSFHNQLPPSVMDAASINS